MTNFIPIFPLNIVVFPGEQLNLHIFEERYKQLIKECLRDSKPFGIPSVIDDKVGELGTLMEVVELSREYEDGKMDIKTRGLKVFRVLEVIKEVPDKLYSGAIVNYPDNNLTRHQKMISKVLTGMRALHELLKINKEFPVPESELSSYDLGHHAGLSLEEEYELLGLFREDQRLEYLKRHLTRVLPVVAGMEELKARVRLNGHFKDLKGFTFGR